eukprot:CAMPEP_0202914926 /NCGR_PEP_ID=MMETSP1392-20130828/64421_1 /ASSEMBLY_ACC=CAM_ASM_000868 /TAXON_ID=225041 /ORGANISM="Chlamydomonas chlamydogama, Strain SAG 11-48b" /LENGTH=99 /DNA_ID=CAMNT_0049606771 /DNA_START=252 /DNA_END=548 /DNA_ORIENTATION=+
MAPSYATRLRALRVEAARHPASSLLMRAAPDEASRARWRACFLASAAAHSCHARRHLVSVMKLKKYQALSLILRLAAPRTHASRQPATSPLSSRNRRPR